MFVYILFVLRINFSNNLLSNGRFLVPQAKRVINKIFPSPGISSFAKVADKNFIVR